MKIVEPFQSIQQAARSLDNGGRFYDFLSRADDGVITTAELAKAAGVYSERQQSILYFSMSISTLDEGSRTRILESLTEAGLEAYKKYRPLECMASEAAWSGRSSQSMVITGVPQYIESNTAFNGFITVTVPSGKSISLVLIPIMDKYDIYRIRDHVSSETFLIAHARGDERLPEVNMKVGGILKELRTGKDPDSRVTTFLEAFYYIL
jgi:hypothetical protein